MGRCAEGWTEKAIIGSRTDAGGGVLLPGGMCSWKSRGRKITGSGPSGRAAYSELGAAGTGEGWAECCGMVPWVDRWGDWWCRAGAVGRDRRLTSSVYGRTHRCRRCHLHRQGSWKASESLPCWRLQLCHNARQQQLQQLHAHAAAPPAANTQDNSNCLSFSPLPPDPPVEPEPEAEPPLPPAAGHGARHMRRWMRGRAG